MIYYMFSELWKKVKDIKIIECIILIYFYMNIYNKIQLIFFIIQGSEIIKLDLVYLYLESEK